MQIESLSNCKSVPERTKTIQKAIDDIHAVGGGVVTIQPGTWEISTIFLRSGVTLDLPANAVLIACPDLSIYPATTTQNENKDRQPFHLLVAKDAENISIIGDGVIDGNGRAFWHEPMRDIAAKGIDVDAYCDEHGLKPVYRNPQHPWYREHKQRISPMVEIKNCRHVRMRGITFANSPGWTVHCHDCDDLHIHGITIDNCLYGPNSDGLDLNGCRDVRISDCDLTCGDDAIIIKSMKDSRLSDNIAVSNCIISTNCAALGLGAEVAHAIRNVTFTGCVIRQALRAFQIEIWETGLIENVVVSNITGVCHTEIPLQRALYVDINCNTRPNDGTWGTVRNIQFSNIVLQTRGRCLFTAPDGAVLEDIVLRDVHLVFDAIENAAVTVPKYLSNQMSNYCPEARVAPAAIVAQNCERLQLHNVITTWPGEGSRAPAGEEVNQPLNPHHDNAPMHGAWLRGCKDTIIESPFLSGYKGAERVCEQESETPK
jgi:polygalacturonase